MYHILKQKEKVNCVKSGSVCTIKEYIGGGGQGEVYAAEFDGRQAAVKWYYPASATKEQRRILNDLVDKKPPNEKFLWPVDIVESSAHKGFGYLMPLRDKRFKSIVDLMKCRIEPGFHALCTAGFHLADSFLELHSRGLSYRDISFDNVFFDPLTGETLISDNDNVAVDGLKLKSILGTPRFMAPEIVTGKAYPSKYTDLYSLAVLLFYIFMVHHPLEGRNELRIKCLDLPAMNKLYGAEPVFIFDPDNDSNPPVPGYHDNAIIYWDIYPQFIQKLFIQSFTKGLLDPENGRVAESVWRSSMIKLRDSIIYCTLCTAENFYDEALHDNAGPVCWSCGKKFRSVPIIQIGSSRIMLNYDTKLFAHHLGDLYNFDKPEAEVVQHPEKPELWGIKNLGEKDWQLTKPDGSVAPVEPGRSASISVKNIIDFGTAQGKILE